MIDNLFNLIINTSNSIPAEFYQLITKLDLKYTKEIIDSFKIERLDEIKQILYTLYELYTDNLLTILNKIKREDLFAIYKVCKTFQTENFVAYYKKSIINKYTNGS